MCYSVLLRALSARGQKSEVGVTHHLFNCRRYQRITLTGGCQSSLRDKIALLRSMLLWSLHRGLRVRQNELTGGNPPGLAMPLVRAGDVDVLLTPECERNGRTISKATVPPQFEHRR
jgi:hypothetical protein